MQPELLDLLKSDIFTDAHEYAERVAKVKQIVAELTFATEEQIAEAREMYQTDEVEIDDLA
jgi:hypothetical protein